MSKRRLLIYLFKSLKQFNYKSYLVSKLWCYTKIASSVLLGRSAFATPEQQGTGKGF